MCVYACACTHACSCNILEHTEHVAIKLFPHFVALIQFVLFADGCSVGNHTSSLTIALKHFTQGINPIAVFWDFDLLDGHGDWWGEGCHIISSADNITTLHSAHFGNFAVLMVSILFRACVFT